MNENALKNYTYFEFKMQLYNLFFHFYNIQYLIYFTFYILLAKIYSKINIF
jgi:uncharacterized membrane protein YagU involved in acid resistance